MATWSITSPVIGVQPITNHETTARHRLGMTIKAADGVLGEAEFIYLTGVANCVAGSVVTYTEGNYQSALMIANAGSLGAVSGRRVAVAMAATVAGEFGWFCIKGNTSVVKNATFASSLLAFSSSAAGSIKSGTTSGQAIEGMFSLGSTIGSANSATTAATDTVVMQLEYPSLQGPPPPATG